MAERLLCSRLKADVADLVVSLPKYTGKRCSVTINSLQESAVKHPSDSAMEWVHRTDVGKVLKVACEATLWISELSLVDTEDRLEAYLTNVAAERGIAILYGLERFDGRMA